MAVQSVRMVTANMLLSVFFLSGALDADPSVTELFMTAPQEMEALSGSCLQIPCNFSAKSENRFNSTRTTYGVWIKDTVDFANNPNDVIFNSSKVDNTYPMNLTGDLSQQNCTTLFSSLITTYTATYYFRMENGPFVATADRDPLKITVNDSPPSPSIEISGVLKEKESVSISCSALTPCPHSPPKLTWNLQQDPHNIIEENKDRTFTTKIQKNFTLSDKDDGLNITCSASYPVNGGKDVKTAEQRKTLSVSYAPKDTSASISPLGRVSAGSWVNLTCSSRANPPVSSFTWFKNSKDGPVNVSEGDVYSFNVTDGGVYYCVAINGLGNERSSEVHITIEDTLQELAAVVGGTIGLIVLIGLVVCVWCLKSTHQTAQQSQNLTVEETASVPEEDIHYGEINFSRRGPELSLALVQDSGEHQDTLYTQVKVSKMAKNATQTDDVPEDLYAKVKKQ
ncbi:myelin-associated glycoprotein-like [Anoplopoma fimbria]|uniref:myelin-associated glycoprotein-like n=1 Tax=Anoplopoma fimbria TaxID=229290 RepID=UPI0023ED0608|nr:myelin-associated glycoprotein-like [Anoplopoma fimbria]XP_054478933.1 myelin-associated glycoprotein-like [Anoplopoma fimbria]